MDLYFRRIESYGREFLPARGRALLIANHQAGLTDGILILAQNEGVVRTLLKHTLLKTPIVNVFAKALNMIPVFRKKDLKPDQSSQSASLDRHMVTFQAVADALKNDELVLVFPEGISHDLPQLQRLRSGAARMLLLAETQNDFRLGCTWIPVSLDLEFKERPGGRALIHYHPPRSIAHLRDVHAKDPEAAIEMLRAEMESVLVDLTLNFSSWEERVFLERLAELWLAQAPNELLLERHNLLLKFKALLEGASPSETDKRHWQQLQRLVSMFTTLLGKSGLEVRDLYATARTRRARSLSWAQLLGLFLFWGPFVTISYPFWWVPITAVKAIVRKGAGSSRDVMATYQMVAGLVLFPAWAIIATVLTATVVGKDMALLLALVALATGIGRMVTLHRIKMLTKIALQSFRTRVFSSELEQLKKLHSNILQQAAAIWNKALTDQIELESFTGSAAKPASKDIAV